LLRGFSLRVFLRVSVNQCRHKSFSMFFPNGRKEKLSETTIADSHSWSKGFLERANQMGLVAASFVKVEKKDMNWKNTGQ
jgi:hypothetical protein